MRGAIICGKNWGFGKICLFGADPDGQGLKPAFLVSFFLAFSSFFFPPNGCIVGQTDKQTDRQTDGRTDGPTDGQMDEGRDGWTDFRYVVFAMFLNSGTDEMGPHTP